MRIKIIFFFCTKKKVIFLANIRSFYVYKFNPTFSFPVFVFIFLFYFIFFLCVSWKAFRWIIITFCNNQRRQLRWCTVTYFYGTVKENLIRRHILKWKSIFKFVGNVVAQLYDWLYVHFVIITFFVICFSVTD